MIHIQRFMDEEIIDNSLGKLDLELNVSYAPVGWDPATIILICYDNLRFYSVKIENSPEISELRDNLSSLRFGNEVNSRRNGFIKAPDGSYVVGMKAKGFLFVENNMVHSRTVVLDGFSHLDKFKGIKNIPPYKEFILPTITGCADGISIYNIECGDGTLLEGHTYYPYVFNNGLSLKEEITLMVKGISINSQKFFQEGVNPQIHLEVEKI